MLNAALGQGRKHFFVLAPLVAQGVFPVHIGGNAVAVANVHCRFAGQPLGGALQGGNAPVGSVFHVDVEGRFVKLDDVHAVGLQGQRLLVEQFGKGKSHLDLALAPAAIKAVGHGVHNRHRAGQGEFEGALGVGAGNAGL